MATTTLNPRTIDQVELRPKSRSETLLGPEAYRILHGLINLDYTGRRTIQLVTPGLDGTSPTIQMSVQLVKPGEVAAAHRHMFAATRFIVRPRQARTRCAASSARAAPRSARK